MQRIRVKIEDFIRELWRQRPI